MESKILETGKEYMFTIFGKRVPMRVKYNGYQVIGSETFLSVTITVGRVRKIDEKLAILASKVLFIDEISTVNQSI